MPKLKRLLTLLIAAFVFVSGPLVSGQQETAEEAASSKIIKAVEVAGNQAISTATIMAKLKTRVGQAYHSQTARDDIKRLYETGFFSDISLDLTPQEDGVKVVFKVEERPIIQEISVEGNKSFRKDVLLRKLKSKTGQYLNLAVLKDDLSLLKKEYEKRGQPEVQIAHSIDIDPKTNKAKVKIAIQEGKKITIRRIYVDGNLHFSDRTIRSLIKTKRKWLFNAGFFKEEEFNDDLERIKDFYQKHGYLDTTVDYRIDYDAKGFLYIRLKIEEGKSYTVGSVSFRGNGKFDDAELLSQIKAAPAGGTFTYDALRQDVANIQGFYFGKGYIYAQIQEAASLDADSGTVAISYAIVENDIVFVDRIDIRGNLKTKDKVIRRELRIKPGERFDGDKLKRSKERLYNLGFFEEVNYDTEPGTKPDNRNLVVDVKEAKTGSFSFGGGYSSIDQFVGFVEIEQKNFDWRNWKTFTGGGQALKLRAELGSVRENFELSFTEPWWFDRPISFGFDLYKRVHDKNADVGYGYLEKRTGGDLRLGKEFNEFIKGGVIYRLEEVDISDVSDSATQDLKDEEGKNLISSLEFTLTRDTTDNVFNPSRGLVLSGSYEVAGGPVGGDKKFNKVFGLASQYFPIFGKNVLQLQARGGVVTPFGGQEKVPIYERFYAGGANTIRGYEERSVGPADPVTADPLGGEALFVFNIEYTVPLLDFVKGAVFIDTGNVWEKASDFGRGGFKTGVGFGVRIKTPIGPLKLDYGIPLNKQPGKANKEGRFHFSMSHGF
ncbi:MAG: outer membrane protein assembly factor BamA [Candidatus Omnitrophota bacterium]